MWESWLSLSYSYKSWNKCLDADGLLGRWSPKAHVRKRSTWESKEKSRWGMCHQEWITNVGHGDSILWEIFWETMGYTSEIPHWRMRRLEHLFTSAHPNWLRWYSHTSDANIPPRLGYVCMWQISWTRSLGRENERHKLLGGTSRYTENCLHLQLQAISCRPRA